MKKIALAIIAAITLANSVKAENSFTLGDSILPGSANIFIAGLTSIENFGEAKKNYDEDCDAKEFYKYHGYLIRNKISWYKKFAAKYPKMSSFAIYLATYFSLQALNKNNFDLLISILKNNSDKVVDFGKNLIKTSCTNICN
ncbi:hypothetical protein KJ644_01660 [Candidatus Dependentiae bacterium]|nr:hypothetical protein [Candidatus Dependentiae bacterium]MBU4387158.1 hypothetical protein [Candidatus Dependentiae bacterium]MCG2756743.1 hypothetical protein [Candidatus Dependentiae bacterium]